MSLIVGIECTAHTFGVGVVRNGKILANIRDMYMPKEGGIVPVEAANHHREISEEIWGKALVESGISEDKMEGIAISNAPGLAPCLYSGMEFAKKKSEDLGIPLIPVNHCVAHLEIGRSVGAEDPVLLYASGANTQVIAYAAGKYRVFGETLDVGIGNFIDKVARYFGIPFPGGPKIENLALKGEYLEIPYSIKGMDVSFSGMETKLKQMFDSGEKIENLAFSLQEIAFAMLVEAAERALAHTGKKELVLGGGVACNSRLQEMCKIMCKERGAKYFCPPKSLLLDNGGMIAYLGELIYDSGNITKMKDIEVLPRQRTDQVNVEYR